MVDVNLAVVSGKRIIQAEGLHTGAEKPVTIKAVKGARYILAEGEHLTGPENITVKRAGNNLWLLLQGSSQPQLIIENYYTYPGEIVGLAEDGAWHAYLSANADRAKDPATLQDGDQSAVLLNSDAVTPFDNLSIDSNALALGLIGIGVVGLASALVLLAQSSGGNDKQDSPPPPDDETTPLAEDSKPDASLDAVSDDAGSKQGVLLPGDISDDNTPTLNGSGQMAGAVIDIQDNGISIGSAVVDAEGHWMFTPETPLDDGSHVFVVIVTDPSGAVSAPSDAMPIVIDTTSTPETPIAMEDLLPADSDVSDWAQMLSNDLSSAEFNVNATVDDAGRLLDEMLQATPHAQ